MVTLADISDYLTRLLGSWVGPVPFFVIPALVLGIGVAVWFLKSSVKKEKVIDPSKGSKLQTAAQYLKGHLLKENLPEPTSEGEEGKVTLDDGLGLDHSKIMETEAEKRLEALRKEIIDDFSSLGILGHGNGDAKNYLNRVVGYSFALALMNSRPKFDEMSFDIVSKEGGLALEMPDGKVGSLIFEPLNEGASIKELETRITRLEVAKQERPTPPVVPTPPQEAEEVV